MKTLVHGAGPLGSLFAARLHEAGHEVALPLVMAIVVFRIRDEEALMHREFGAEWEACCEKTRGLIPRIW